MENRQPYNELWPAQKLLMEVEPDVDFDIACYQGGYGSGKTFVGALLGLVLCQRHPGIKGMAVAKTYPLLRDTTLEMYFQHLDTFGFREGLDYVWKATQSKLLFPCWKGSEILFRHLERPGKLKSLTLGWIHAEEMSQLTESDFLMLLSRMRQPDIHPYRFFGTTNPEDSKGWIYRYFVEKAGQEIASLSTGKTFKTVYRRIVASTRENKALPEGYVETLVGAFDKDYAAMNIEGLDSEYSSGLVCKGLHVDNFIDTRYRENYRIYLSCDFNVDPMCWVLAHRIGAEYHFFDELCLENTNTFGAISTFIQKYQHHQSGITITGDASGYQRSTKSFTPGHTDYTIIQNALIEAGYSDIKLDIRLSNPHVKDRVSAWNALIENALGQRRIFINPHTCPKLKWNCENLRYIPGSSEIWEPSHKEIQFDLSKVLKYTKHPFDAASYLIERYDSITLKAKSYDRNRPKIVSSWFH